MHRQIAGKLTGPVTKWIVLVGAVVLVGLMAPLNAKLVDVQNNEASSWLPGSAESTKVVEELTGTVDPNDIPTLVVYHRDGGLTEAERRALEACPNTNVVTIPGTSFFLPNEEPGRIAGLLVEALGRQ